MSLEIPQKSEYDEEEGYQTGFHGNIPLLKDLLKGKGPSFAFFHVDPDKDENIAFEERLDKGHVREGLQKLIANIRALRDNKKNKNV